MVVIVLLADADEKEPIALVDDDGFTVLLVVDDYYTAVRAGCRSSKDMALLI